MMITAAGMSDEEDSDEGFSFGSSLPRSNTYRSRPVDARTSIENELFAAIKHGDLCAIQKALDNDFDVTLETPLQGSWTPLLHACSNVNIPVVKFLIQEGASVNTHAALFTPLMAICSTTNNTEENVCALVKILLDNNADVNFTDAHGVTALMLACQVGYVSVVTELLAHKARVNQLDNQGRNALFWAINENHYQICSLLIEKNCNTELQDIRGLTCYQLALSNDSMEIVDLLDSCTGGRKPSPFWEEARNFIENVEWRTIVPGEKWCGAEEPSYYPELDSILNGMQLEQHIPDIIHNGITYIDFLTMDEEQLQGLTFLLPYERRIIIQHLKLFHTRPWTKQSIHKPAKGDKFNIFNLLIQLAGVYKHITIIHATVKALNKLSDFENGLYKNDKKIMVQVIDQLKESLADLKKQLAFVRNMLIKVSMNTDKPAEFIGADLFKKVKPKRNWFKYTIFTFLPIAAIYSIKKVIKTM